MSENNSKELINYIASAPKSTPSVFFIKSAQNLNFENCDVFEAGDKIVFGDYEYILSVVSAAPEAVEKKRAFIFARNSGVATACLQDFSARIESGAIIREKAEIGLNAVIMMGAVVNIGARIGERTMVDMNAVIGGRAQIGADCHIGAGAVIAGVIEPPSAEPVRLGDNVTVGANAVVLEGIEVGSGAVIAAGAVVTKDVPAGAVAAGVPAKIIKYADEKTRSKTATVKELRK